MKTLLFTLLFCCGFLGAQNVIPSNTYVRTCLNDVECASINSSSTLYYDEATSKFYISLDFNEMKTGTDSVDFWLQDLSDTYLIFKAGLVKEDLPGLSNYNAKTIRLQGQMYLNKIWRKQTIDVSIYRAETDMLSNSTDGNKIEAYKVNFSFSFSPKDFDIHKKPNRLTNVIFVGVGAGHINPLKPGQEAQLGEAYLHE